MYAYMIYCLFMYDIDPCMYIDSYMHSVCVCTHAPYIYIYIYWNGIINNQTTLVYKEFQSVKLKR